MQSRVSTSGTRKFSTKIRIRGRCLLFVKVFLKNDFFRQNRARSAVSETKTSILVSTRPSSSKLSRSSTTINSRNVIQTSPSTTPSSYIFRTLSPGSIRRLIPLQILSPLLSLKKGSSSRPLTARAPARAAPPENLKPRPKTARTYTQSGRTFGACFLALGGEKLDEIYALTKTSGWRKAGVPIFSPPKDWRSGFTATLSSG